MHDNVWMHICVCTHMKVYDFLASLCVCLCVLMWVYCVCVYSARVPK